MARILVIDDASEVREVILNVVQAGGHEGIGAKDALTALELIKEQVPDLIICDIMMPKMDGYQFLEKLRSNPGTMIVPFIFLTARSDRADQRRGMLLGADDYITKPFSVSELLEAIEVRLAKHEAVSQAFRKEMDDLQGRATGSTLPNELRTPLSGILTTSKVLLELRETLNAAKVFEIVGVIHGVADRLYHLVDNYVLFSELALIADKPHILEALKKQETGETEELLTQVAVEVAGRFEREDDLILALSDCGVRMTGTYVGKIAAELMDNALKFSLPGTPVTLRTQTDNGTFVLSVTDAGRGMTAKEIACISDSAQPAPDPHERKESGLGLVIVRELARLHEGTLEIESVPGNKTTVRVTLPAS